MSKVVDELLRDWARWKAREDDAGLGHKNKVSWADERIQRSVDTFIPDVDPDILRVDAAIKQLPDKYRKVIWWHYTEYGPVKVKAARLNLNRTRWYEHLEHAQAFLESLMERVVV